MDNKPILVIGDACLDIFVYCHCNRLCPEAPVPVLDVRSTTHNLGMAGNVYQNLIDLGKETILVCNTNYTEVTKVRYVEPKTNHMFLRIDSPAEIGRIKDIGNLDLSAFEAIVISDYNKGFLLEEDIRCLTQKHPVCFLDTKKPLGSWAEEAAFIKINRAEYLSSKRFLTPKLESKIIETLGEEGCRFKEKVFPVKKVEIKNLSGAGDSFLAGLVSTYVDTRNIESSIQTANEIATIVVQKMGVSTVKS